jgi:class 3 adenylate cyclase
VAIVFSDIEGSTALNELVGDEQWFSVLAEHDQILRNQVQCHHGLEVKRLGDGFMLAFASTIDALECAVSIQRGIAERNRSKRPEIRVRIGVHAGTPIYEARDFVGRDVTLAARVAAHAQGGEILVSDAARASDRSGAFAFRRIPPAKLDGFRPSVQLHRLEWIARPTLTVIDSRVSHPDQTQSACPGDGS